MTARYALYYVPPADHPLYVAASAWLGRDAYTGQSIARPHVAGLDVAGLADADMHALTEDPGHYGWHATLKAPFELAPDQSERALLAAVEEYCANRSPFDADLRVAALGDFLAFTLAAPSLEMATLHEDCVRRFDRFRAPLSEFDLARRRRGTMTAEQDARLVAFGYPWIFEDFRFHMTLTGRIRDAAESARMLTVLQAHFVPLEGPHLFDGLAVFFQPDRDSDFTVLGRSMFQG